jgi:PAS domain S-box-containing protein
MEPIKFLLVDDTSANLDALEALLARAELQTLRATTGNEALELLLVHDFALALIDVQMPGMSGLELAELMRGASRTRDVPIILLTASTDQSLTFKGYEAGAVDYLAKPIDSHMLMRKAEVFFELASQRRELLRQRDELEASERRFRRALLLAPTPMALFDDQGNVLTINSEWLELSGWKAAELTSLDGWLDPSCATAAELLQRFEDLVTGKTGRVAIECEMKTPRGTLTWELAADCVGENFEGRRLFVCIAHDVTERTQSERVRKMLVNELNHRVKNTLATVQSFAWQTFKGAEPAKLESFAGRLAALSKAHNILTVTAWEKAGLHKLVANAIEAFGPDRFEVRGPACDVDPKAAVTLTMVLHELATNAVKYGALSVLGGKVHVHWMAEGLPDVTNLHLVWEETGGPAVTQPTRDGFGTRLIERQLTAEFGGNAALDFCETGLICRIQLSIPGSLSPAIEAAWSQAS